MSNSEKLGRSRTKLILSRENLIYNKGNILTKLKAKLEISIVPDKYK